MKKFLTQQINFAYALIVMLALTIGVGFVGAVGQQNDYVNTISPLIHVGGGEQAVSGLRVGTCSGGACIGSFDVRGALNNIALFDNTSSVSPLFLVTGNVGIVGKLFVGENAGPNLSLWSNSYGGGAGGLGGSGGFTIPLQRVNVYGNTRATNLTNTSAPATVCVDPSGVLVLCGAAAPINGQCGISNGGTFSTPPVTGLCNQGDASAVTTNVNTYNWTCGGLNGGTTASCQATRSVITNAVCHDFGAGPFATQPATGQNGCDAGSYEDTSDSQYLWKWNCNGSANGGQDVNCTEPRTQTYSWQIGNWGTCNVTPSTCTGTYQEPGQGNPNGSHTSNPARSVTYDGRDCNIVDDGGSWQNNCQVPSPDEFCHLSIVRVCDYETIQVTKQCSAFNNNQTSCQSKPTCTWKAQTSNQIRSVLCKDQNGSTVADSFCSQPKPITSQSC